MNDHLNSTTQGGTSSAVEDVHGISAEDYEVLRQIGQSLIAHLFSASKTVRIYNMNNRATQRVLNDLIETLITQFARESRAIIRVSNDFLLLNDHRIPVDPQNFAPFEYIVGEMKKRQVESIEFLPDIKAEQLGEFLRVFFDVDPVEAAYEQLQLRMSEAGVTQVVTVELVEQETRLADLDRNLEDVKVRSNRVYFQTVSLMGDVLRTVEEKHILQVRKAKRLTQQMVDIIGTDESLLVGLASIKSFDAYTFAHSVNVCILTMLIADRIGLDKSEVARMGVAALFHDIGKTYIPATIINSTGELSPREWELMKYHTFFGVKELSRLNALREASESMFVALQHHVHYNNNGYPQRPGGWKLRLFSRITTVADYYDAMTASRTYREDPIRPDNALRFILEKSGSIFDPFVVKVFIQAMGLYPVGTIVQLDSGEIGVVIKQNPAPCFIHRPITELVDPSAIATEDREVADLTETTPDGRFKKSVERTIHNSDIELDRRSIFVQTE